MEAGSFGSLGPMVRIHDTMAGADVELTTRVPDRVSMYVCGPTVYDAPHIGHGRTALAFDMVRRYLTWRGYDVTYVSNVTNVEDKIIARAAREGMSEQDLADHWESVYWEALDRLGVAKPDEIPRATEFIDQMIALHRRARRERSCVRDRGRGRLLRGRGVPGIRAALASSGRRPAEQRGARVDVDERKRSAVDFALWKAAKPGEPDWDSPWGRGRPGWHIECSAMSLELLGESFDLHGGGNDLVFPHHENERARRRRQPVIRSPGIGSTPAW